MKMTGAGLLRLLLAGFASLAAQWARPVDVSVYLVKKGLEYTQTDSGVPSLNATNSNAFEAEVVMSGVNTVTNAAVQPPGGVPLQPLALSTGNKWDYKPFEAHQARANKAVCFIADRKRHDDA